MTAARYETMKLNPEPTDVQWASYRRHCAAGTTPGNPRWYQVPTLPATRVFKANAAPVYPELSKGTKILPVIRFFPKPKQLPAEPTTRDYVEIFDKENHYVTTSTV